MVGGEKSTEHPDRRLEQVDVLDYEHDDLGYNHDDLDYDHDGRDDDRW